MNGQIKETVGASSSSRIWSNQRLSIPNFVDWIRTLNGRIAGDVPFSATHLDIVIGRVGFAGFSEQSSSWEHGIRCSA